MCYDHGSMSTTCDGIKSISLKFEAFIHKVDKEIAAVYIAG